METVITLEGVKGGVTIPDNVNCRGSVHVYGSVVAEMLYTFAAAIQVSPTGSDEHVPAVTVN